MPTIASVTVEAGLKDLTGTGFSKLESTISKYAAKYQNTLLKGLTVPVGALLGFSVHAAAQFERLKLALDSVTGSSAETARQLVRLKAIGELPGISFEEAVRGSLRLQSVGLSAKEAEEALKQFSNEVARTGGGAEEFARALEQIQQMLGKGKLMGDDLRALANSLPTVRKLLQETFGSADPEVLEKAGISAREALSKLVAKMSESARVSAGLGDALDNAGAAMKQAAADAGLQLAPYITKAANAISGLTEAFSNLNDVSKGFVLTIVGAGGMLGVLALMANAYFKVKAAALEARTAILAARAASIAAGEGAAASATGFKILGASLGEIGVVVVGVIAGLEAIDRLTDKLVGGQERYRKSIEDASASFGQWIQRLNTIERMGKKSGLPELGNFEKYFREHAGEIDAASSMVIQKRIDNLMRRWKVGYADLEKSLKTALAKIKAATDGVQSQADRNTGKTWAKTALPQPADIQAVGNALEDELVRINQLVRGVLATEAQNRQSPKLLELLGLGGDTSDLDKAKAKLDSIDAAIKQIIEIGNIKVSAGPVLGFTGNKDAMTAMNKLLSDREHALIQVAAAERTAADAAAALTIEQNKMAYAASQSASVWGPFIQKAIDAYNAMFGIVDRGGIIRGFFKSITDSVKAFEGERLANYKELMQGLSLEMLKYSKGAREAAIASLMLNQSLTRGQAESVVNLQTMIDKMKEMKELADDIAGGIADAFIDGLRRVQKEGFAGFLAAFEQMLLDMALAVARAQVFNLLQNVFGGLLGGLGGGGGVGVPSGGGYGSSGGTGQTQTGFGQLQQQQPIQIVMNIQTPDAGSFRRSQDQIMDSAFKQSLAFARRSGA